MARRMIHDAVQVGGGHQDEIVFAPPEHLCRPPAQLRFCFDGDVLVSILIEPGGLLRCTFAAEHGALGDEQVDVLGDIGGQRPPDPVLFPHDAVIPEIPGEQNALPGGLDIEHIGVQGGMVHIQRQDADAGGRFDPLLVRIGFHPLHPGQTLFLFAQVDIGDKHVQNLFGQRADVQGNIFRNALE